MSDTISIIIPTFNRLHTLRIVLASYLKQQCLHELIIVDDGSSDGTYSYISEMARQYPCLRVLRHEANLGLCQSKNDAVELATGDYVLIGEDDLYLSDDYAVTLLRCLREASADVIAGRIVYSRVGETFDDTMQRCDGYRGPLVNYWLMSIVYSKRIDDHAEVSHLHAISLMKATVARSIRWDPAFFAREETDFYLRAARAGCKIVLCPHTVCVHLPRDKGKGGGWSVGLLRYQYLATKNNNMLIERHYEFLKQWGMKGNKLTFKVLHLLNRLRIMYLFYRFSTRQNMRSEA